ncbi:MAG: TonB family protein [Spirochaetales bacterium]|nr:TonB family protein [Spirochaetales bacterium]
MNVEKFSKYSGCIRPALFVLVLAVHAAVISMFSFRNESTPVETVDFREAEVFKLVDVQEFVPPPPEVKEVKETVKVSKQPEASENITETEKKVETEPEEIVYLPQHKISSVPVIPVREILSRIEYPSMALKQGIEAVVYLELFIDSTGTIRNIKVLKDPGHGFAQAAVKAFDGITCIPAIANGKACAVKFRYPVKFTLN